MLSQYWVKSNLKKVFLFVFALAINGIYLSCELNSSSIQESTHPGGMTWIAHAYSLYTYGILNKVAQISIKKHGYVLKSEKEENPVFCNPSVGDTIGYPLVAYGVWNFFGVPSLLYLKILNIFLFACIALLLYKVNKWLFGEPFAFWATLAVIFFPPLIYVNVIWFRDIFQYFGTIVFFYFFLSFIKQKQPLWFTLLGISLCVLCQWVRASLFPSYMILSGIVFVLGCLKFFDSKKVMQFLILFWMNNLLLFWLPFFAFNKITYGYYFVGPTEEALFCSICSPYPLPDGELLTVEGYFDYADTQMAKGVIPHVEKYEKFRLLYERICKLYPYRPLQCFLYRLRAILTDNIQWRLPEFCNSFDLKAFLYGCFSLENVMELCLRALVPFIRMFGSLGVVIAFLKKETVLLGLLFFGVVYGSGYMLLTHIEGRILAVHAWPFSIFTCYFFVYAYSFIRKRVMHERLV